MWKCPKCGEEIDDRFDSCWQCAKAESSPGTASTTQAKRSLGGFWCAWRRGWYVLLMIVVYGLVQGLLKEFYRQSAGRYLEQGDNPLALLAVIAAAALLLPPCAYGIFVLFFGKEAWPWGKGARKDSQEVS
jgi:hypothetical protein